jgi:SulP family sulfate permease
MMAVFSLINIEVIKESWIANKQDGAAAVVTFFATLAFAPNIQNGILTGILLSLVLFLFRTMKPAVVLLGVDEDGVLHNAKRYNLPKMHPEITAIRYDGQLYFANVNYFEESILYMISSDPELKHILVVGDGINGLDATGVDMLRNLLDRLQQHNVEISFCNLKENVLDVLQRTGLIDKLGADHIYPSVKAALFRIDQAIKEKKENEPKTGELHE